MFNILCVDVVEIGSEKTGKTLAVICVSKITHNRPITVVTICMRWKSKKNVEESMYTVQGSRAEGYITGH